MKKDTKGLIIILILLILILFGYIGYIFYVDMNKEDKIEDVLKDEDVLDVEDNKEENKEENKDKENQLDIEVEENNDQNIVKENTSTEPKNEYIGKEEKESNEEVESSNPDEKALKLAKEKFGKNSSVYVFKIDFVEGDIYHISVVSNATTIAYIDVNIKTGIAKKI